MRIEKCGESIVIDERKRFIDFKSSNNNNISFFLQFINQYRPIKVRPSIDLIWLSIHWTDYYDVEKYFQDEFEKCKTIINKEDCKTVIKIFRCGDSRIELCHNGKTFGKPMIHLYQPTFKLQEKIFDDLVKRSVEPILNYMELTFDFYKKDIFKLKEAFESYLFVKHHKSTVNRVKDTLYVAQRKSAKTVVVYTKKEGGKLLLRFEVRLRRRVIKRKAYTFPFKGENIDFFDFIDFRILNREKLIDHIIRKYKGLKPIKPSTKYPHLTMQLLRRTVDSYLSNFLYQANGENSALMETLAGLRDSGCVKNVNTFLNKTDDELSITDFMNLLWKAGIIVNTEEIKVNDNVN